MDDTSPPSGRVCLTLLSAGILGVDGSLPLCIGQGCSQYEQCRYDALQARAKILKMTGGKL